jgi:hypothetical protein
VFLVYSPEDGDVQRFPYNPRKMMSPEMEAIEKVTDRGWSAFTADVVQGNALCRRALLWVFLKRQHPVIKFADVSFMWDELSLEYSKQEYTAMIEEVQQRAGGAEAEAMVAKFSAERDAALDEDGEYGGKARLPVAD